MNDPDGPRKETSLVNTDKDDDFNRATRIVADIRKAIYDELGFTCSAGISVNKMAAKFIAGLKKPNAQDRIFELYLTSCSYTKYTSRKHRCESR